MNLIWDYIRAKGLVKPKWLKKGKAHYPSLAKIYHHLGMDSIFSDKSLVSSSDSEYSLEGPHSLTKPSITVASTKIGVDPSLGRDNELFGIRIKNINTLEKGLGPPTSGKKKKSLFLNKTDDMMVYLRHVSQNNSDLLGVVVNAVTGLNNHHNGRKGGTKDTGWQNKNRNSLEYIKSNYGLNIALSYLLK